MSSEEDKYLIFASNKNNDLSGSDINTIVNGMNKAFPSIKKTIDSASSHIAKL